MLIGTLNVRGVRKQHPSVPALVSSTMAHRWIKDQKTDLLALTETQLADTALQDGHLLAGLERSLGAHTSVWSRYCGLLLSNNSLSLLYHTFYLEGRALLASVKCSTSSMQWDVFVVYSERQNCFNKCNFQLHFAITTLTVNVSS